MATVATISVNFAQYDSISFTTTGVLDRSINPRTLSQYCLGSSTADLSYLGGFVKKTGDSMSGPLILNSTSTPSLNEAARVAYVESRVASLSATISDPNAGGFVKISGSTMTGSLLLNTSSPSALLQATSKGYVDSRISSLSSTTETKLIGEYLPLNGGTMRGAINMNGNKIFGFPTNTVFTDSDLVTKAYVDSTISSATAGGASVAYVNQESAKKVNKSGDTMTGALVLPASDPTDINHATRKKYVDDQIAVATGAANSASGAASTLSSTKVSKSGDTMTGALVLPASDPTDLNHATRKKYVDDRDAVAIGAASAAQTTANAASTAAANANNNANARVARSGDTMTGSLAVQGNITATGDVTAYSDSRLKKNVNVIDDALNKVLKLKGVTFEKIFDNKKSLGVIAQDVFEVLPEVITEEKDGYLSVAYGNIVGVLIEAIKELSNKVDKLEKELNK